MIRYQTNRTNQENAVFKLNNQQQQQQQKSGKQNLIVKQNEKKTL